MQSNWFLFRWARRKSTSACPQPWWFPCRRCLRVSPSSQRPPVSKIFVIKSLLTNSNQFHWHTVAQFELIGSWNVSKICTMYGRIDVMPQNCEIAKQNMTTAKGRIVRFRTSSFILSRRFPLACVHLTCVFWQGIHEFEFSEYRCISLNSFSTAFGDTQPRSHCSDFKASSFRFLERSHSGVSGIYTCTWNELCNLYE